MAHQVQLSWNADADAVGGYNVYRGTATGQETLKINEAPVNSTTYTDMTPNVGSNFYVIKAIGLNSVESVASNEVNTVILPAAPTGLTVVSSS